MFWISNFIVTTGYTKYTVCSRLTCNHSFTGIEENIGTVDVDVEHPHDVSDDRMETEHSLGKGTLMQKSCAKQNHWQKIHQRFN